MLKDKNKRKVFLRDVSVIIFMMLMSCMTGCSGSRTGTEITFSEYSVEESIEDSEYGKDVPVSETDMAMPDDLEEPAYIYVHICGAVKNPGVYELKSDSRVYEVIDAAGGLTKDADEAAVNQAGRIEDGQQIYVYTKEETKESRERSNPTDGFAVDEVNDTSSKVNLNTAGKEELMSLTGIGEAKAKAIIDYRESNGVYSSIEDIMKIDGIKQGVFQKIKDDITI